MQEQQEQNQQLKIKQSWGAIIKKRFLTVILYVIPITGFIVGIYLLFNILSPAIELGGSQVEQVTNEIKVSRPKIEERRIYISQLGVNLPIVQAADKSEQSELIALDKGMLNRSPSSGNPKDGGNYVLAAHRFDIGWNPQITRAKSPLYHIERMKVDDEVYVDYDGQRYVYRIYEIKTVAPTEVGIEDKTNDNRLTLYTCELGGSEAGRVVLLAKQIGNVTWDASGNPSTVVNGEFKDK